MSSNTSKNIIFKTLVDDEALPLYPKTSVNQIQIDDDHGLSDMLVTMCNTISDNTTKITSIENKSPELPNNVKQLLINLFSSVYGKVGQVMITKTSDGLESGEVLVTKE